MDLIETTAIAVVIAAVMPVLVIIVKALFTVLAARRRRAGRCLCRDARVILCLRVLDAELDSLLAGPVPSGNLRRIGDAVDSLEETAGCVLEDWCCPDDVEIRTDRTARRDLADLLLLVAESLEGRYPGELRRIVSSRLGG